MADGFDYEALENAREYARLQSEINSGLDALEEGLTRFAEGVYVIWYPILTRGDHIRLIESLGKLSEKTLNIAMTVQEPDEKGFGMLGSGLFVINPPWTLKGTMETVMPYLLEKLAQYPGASYEITSSN